MAKKTLPQKSTVKPIGFGPAINEATMRSMEQGATSKDRGIARRLVLLAMSRDAESLEKLSVDDPVGYGAMRDAINDFEDHAQALLDVAKAASFRMNIAGGSAL